MRRENTQQYSSSDTSVVVRQLVHCSTTASTLRSAWCTSRLLVPPIRKCLPRQGRRRRRKPAGGGTRRQQQRPSRWRRQRLSPSRSPAVVEAMSSRWKKTRPGKSGTWYFCAAVMVILVVPHVTTTAVYWETYLTSADLLYDNINSTSQYIRYTGRYTGSVAVVLLLVAQVYVCSGNSSTAV